MAEYDISGYGFNFDDGQFFVIIENPNQTLKLVNGTEVQKGWGFMTEISEIANCADTSLECVPTGDKKNRFSLRVNVERVPQDPSLPKQIIAGNTAFFHETQGSTNKNVWIFVANATEGAVKKKRLGPKVKSGGGGSLEF
jgi:hypothetical protein